MYHHSYHPHHPTVYAGCCVILQGEPRYLRRVKVGAHTTILATTSRTTLTQTFVNPLDKPIDELRYVFPLYDGVSVVGFTCTIGSRVIKGVVREQQRAKQIFKEATDRGEVAGLFEQSLEAADVFTTTLGNVPAKGTVNVEITYLGELKHDAEVDGVRFTIPTKIAARYGSAMSLRSDTQQAIKEEGMEMSVDVEMPEGSAIKSVQSPTHPLSVTIGTTSTAPNADPSLRKASATLSVPQGHLEADFVIQVTATNLGEPSAVLETHPTIPRQRALMATLVPKFSLPAEKPEIVFICDRSGSMGNTIPELKAALLIFLKSLPVGVKFNICSFGSTFSFLWERSKTYSQESLNEAVAHVETFAANFGGTEMYEPFNATFKQRYSDLNLEVFCLTDGEIWDQDRLFDLINTEVDKSKGAIRVFTLGVGDGASSSLIEGVARAGNGFSQTVGAYENMNKKVVRMLKGALFPHISDYKLEIKYDTKKDLDMDHDFELVEKVADMDIKDTAPPPPPAYAAKTGSETKEPKGRKSPTKKIISLFNRDTDKDDAKPDNDNIVEDKFAHLPSVTVPRYIQAPFNIPPLFPFNRTTVYVMLSDETPDLRPKSVVLKGTSSYGDLELEIPVTILEDTSSTIHQLAARKEVKELEEGRGWLSFAKDADGKLLKTKYEGRFSDMVEREAVRLGEKYQVSGKWCSFVAVQEDDDAATITAKPETTSPMPHADQRNRSLGASVGARSARRTSGSIIGSMGSLFGSGSTYQYSSPQGFGGPAPAFQDMLFGQPAPQGAQQQQSYQLQQVLPCGSAEPQCMGYSFGAPTSAGQMGMSSPPRPLKSKSMSMGSSSPATQVWSAANAMRSSARAPPPPPAPAMKARCRGSAPLAPSVGESWSADPASDDSDDEEDLGGCAQWGVDEEMEALSSVTRGYALESVASAPSAPANRATGDALHDLTSLQTFVGSWSWNPTLEAVLGLTWSAASCITLPDAVAAHPAKNDILATVCAIAYFKNKLANDKEAWEMIVDKAEGWLRGQVGEATAELEATVAKLF